MKSEMMIYDPVLAVAFSKNHDKLKSLNAKTDTCISIFINLRYL